jgi:hypothetical protein
MHWRTSEVLKSATMCQAAPQFSGYTCSNQQSIKPWDHPTHLDPPWCHNTAEISPYYTQFAWCPPHKFGFNIYPTNTITSKIGLT